MNNFLQNLLLILSSEYLPWVRFKGHSIGHILHQGPDQNNVYIKRFVHENITIYNKVYAKNKVCWHGRTFLAEAYALLSALVQHLSCKKQFCVTSETNWQENHGLSIFTTRKENYSGTGKRIKMSVLCPTYGNTRPFYVNWCYQRCLPYLLSVSLIILPCLKTH